MKIYVVTTGENAITVSLNGEAAVAKTVKPTLTALGNGRIRFQCDGIDEEVETYRNIFINAVPLKGSWIAEEDYLSVTLFEAVMNKTFVSGSPSPGGSSYLSFNVVLAQVDEDPPTQRNFQNDFGGTVWTRAEPGAYNYMTDIDWDINKFQIPGYFIRSAGDALTTERIEFLRTSVATPLGSWQIGLTGGAGGKTEISLTILNEDNEFTDISSFDPVCDVYLPEIRYYSDLEV